MVKYMSLSIFRHRPSAQVAPLQSLTLSVDIYNLSLANIEVKHYCFPIPYRFVDTLQPVKHYNLKCELSQLYPSLAARSGIHGQTVPDNWENIYRRFFHSAAAVVHQPTRITLGTYREMGRSLLPIAAKWGLPPIEWIPEELSKEGMHYHIPGRLDIYRQLMGFIKSAWRQAETTPFIALCKESRFIREVLGLNHSHCNCE